jgi:hypothetical protein
MQVDGFKTLGQIIFSVWIFGAVVYAVSSEFERRADCIKYEGWIKGTFFCNTGSYSRIQQGNGFTYNMVKGLAWPVFIFQSTTDD